MTLFINKLSNYLIIFICLKNFKIIGTFKFFTKSPYLIIGATLLFKKFKYVVELQDGMKNLRSVVLNFHKTQTKKAITG